MNERKKQKSYHIIDFMGKYDISCSTYIIHYTPLENKKSPYGLVTNSGLCETQKQPLWLSEKFRNVMSWQYGVFALKKRSCKCVRKGNVNACAYIPVLNFVMLFCMIYYLCFVLLLFYFIVQKLCWIFLFDYTLISLFLSCMWTDTCTDGVVHVIHESFAYSIHNHKWKCNSPLLKWSHVYLL